MGNGLPRGCSAKLLCKIPSIPYYDDETYEPFERWIFFRRCARNEAYIPVGTWGEVVGYVSNQEVLMKFANHNTLTSVDSQHLQSAKKAAKDRRDLHRHSRRESQ